MGAYTITVAYSQNILAFILMFHPTKYLPCMVRTIRVDNLSGLNCCALTSSDNFMALYFSHNVDKILSSQIHKNLNVIRLIPTQSLTCYTIRVNNM